MLSKERLQEIKEKMEGPDLSTDDLLEWAPKILEEVERLRKALQEAEALASENEGAFKVWRRRCEEADREAERLKGIVRNVHGALKSAQDMEEAVDGVRRALEAEP